MPKNPDLVPTVIVDMNGRTTVVHKLRGLFKSSGSSPSTSQIPAPTVPGPGASKTKLVRSLEKSVQELTGITDKAFIKRLGNDLYDNFSVESVRMIAETVADGGDLADGVVRQLVGREVKTGWAGKAEAQMLEQKIRNNIFFYPLVDTRDYLELRGLVEGATCMEPFSEVRDFGDVGERLQNQCVAVMVATRELVARYPLAAGELAHPVHFAKSLQGDDRWLLRETLLPVVLQRPEDVEKIVDTVVKHRTSNAAAVSGLMMGLDVPLAEGAL